jgi:surface polysaccharide O-acyltransferase-like enzyme
VGAIIDYGVLGPLKMSYWNIQYFIERPGLLFFQGSKVHLWFLMSLAICIAISSIFIDRGRTGFLYVLAATFYVFGMLAKAYALTPIGIPIDFNTRHGPFFGLIFFCTGHFLSTHKRADNSLAVGLVLLLIGYALVFVELHYLHANFGTSYLQDYVVGTYFIGVGSAVIVLSNTVNFTFSKFPKIMSVTLGIYAVHFIFIDILKPFETTVPIFISNTIFPIAVALLSIFTAVQISETKYFRRFVT